MCTAAITKLLYTVASTDESITEKKGTNDILKKTGILMPPKWYQEYIRTRVCNTTHWGLARRNFK